MCLTITLGLTNDDDKLIRASALRTLGVYVMYKSLREVRLWQTDKRIMCLTITLGLANDDDD